MSDFSLEPTGVTPPPPLSQRAGPWRTATTVLAVLCVALGFLLFRATGGFGSPDQASAESMVVMACSIMEDVEPASIFENEGEDADPFRELERLSTASALARLAALEDPALSEFGEIVSMARVSGLSQEPLTAMVDDTRAYCDDR